MTRAPTIAESRPRERIERTAALLLMRVAIERRPVPSPCICGCHADDRDGVVSMHACECCSEGR